VIKNLGTNSSNRLLKGKSSSKKTETTQSFVSSLKVAQQMEAIYLNSREELLLEKEEFHQWSCSTLMMDLVQHLM